MKKILKEAVCMALIAIAVMIILVLVFYDYLKVDTAQETAVAYTRSDAVKGVIAEEPEGDELIATFSENKVKSQENNTVDEDTGKQHPFSNTIENEVTIENTVQNEVSNEVENTVEILPSNEVLPTQKKDTQKKDTQKKETKKKEPEKKKEERKPFFDDGTSK